MNIQIFGRKKCFDTKKAERFFKERGIKFQSIDLDGKGLSKRELESVMHAVGGIDKLIDNNETVLLNYLSDTDRFDKLLECPYLLKSPIVRNGKAATVGFCPDVWKGWQ